MTAATFALIAALVAGTASAARAEPIKFDALVAQKEAVVSGTGKLSTLKGAGTFHLVPTGPTERRFVLQGELTQ